jgi:bla regulator protein blaR1
MTAAQWLEVLVSYSVQVLIVIAACKLIDRSIPRTPDRCAIWNTCFFSILILGLSAVLLPRLHLLQPWSRLQPHTLLSVSTAQAVVGKLLLAVWCIGASVSLIRWVTRGYCLRRTLRECERLSPTDVERLLGLTHTEANGIALPTLLISDDADGPFCWQLHQPTVVLPRFLLEGNEDDLRHVLVHELEHLKTNHPFQLFMQHLVQVICWFHPAVWNAGSWASLVREFSCDEAAAAQGANSAAYLRTLLHIAERCEQKRNTSAIAFGRTPSEIVLRARRLVDMAKGPNESGRRGGLGKRGARCILVALTCLLCLMWIPTDPLASSRSVWSPWPKWTANTLHCFGINLRDYEQYDRRIQAFEILHSGDDQKESRDESMAVHLPRSA